MLGWRVYVTNQPPQELSLQSAVVAYREEYLIERGFGRFKGLTLSLTPIYLQRDDYVKGLIRLLSIGGKLIRDWCSRISLIFLTSSKMSEP